MTFVFPSKYYDLRHLDGRNTDVDAAEDIWAGGGDYPFPSAAAETNILSDSANDTSNGTGARTVYITGLNSAWYRVTETVTLNGVTPVTLANQYLRINMAIVVTVGNGAVNAGNIDVRHGTTVLARIPTGYGTISQAVYTIPMDYRYGALIAWHAGMLRTTNALADVDIMIRPNGESWRIEDHALVSQSQNKNGALYVPIIMSPKADIKLRVSGVSAGNTDIYGGFHLMLWHDNRTFRFETIEMYEV